MGDDITLPLTPTRAAVCHTGSTNTTGHDCTHLEHRLRTNQPEGPGLTGTGFGGSHLRSNERSCLSVGVLLLVLDRWDVAEALVQAGGVVPADVLDDCELELARVRQTRSVISSVLKLSTNDSARALS